MDVRRGCDRLAWFAAGVAFLVILVVTWGEVIEDIEDTKADNISAASSMDWLLVAGVSIGGAIVVWAIVRGIGWVWAGFAEDK